MKFENQIDNYLNKLKETIDNLDRNEINLFEENLLDAYKEGKNIFIFGNGGSAVTASHFACDINKGVSYGLKKRFKVIPLTDNMGTLTAYSNDVGYESIFKEQLKNFLQDGDIVIGVSGSGNSKNVTEAIEYANSRGNLTIGITGYDGGKLKKISRNSINANINDMQISEDIHMIIVHLTMQIMQNALMEEK